MRPETSLSNRDMLWRIAQKEISLFFASPVSYLFLGSFLAVTLFMFFWGEAFFARNIADVRPLFNSMPLLLIFLASSLTMRLWSEERRSGTLEHVLTQSAPLWQFVLGKFIGCSLLLLLALLLTLPLPFTVAMLGELDWGPVWAGYLATLLLGMLYLAIGLYASARSDNPIVALLVSVLLCGVFYLVGSSIIAGLFGQHISQWLSLLSTSGRFEAISRGMLDARDLLYFVSLTLVFLTLNTLALERGRWSEQPSQASKRWQWAASLIIVNALALNLWLGQLSALRFDSTAGQQFTLSPASKQQLAQLQEPLLLRGYFSSKTHPLLAPLVPQLSDLLREYEIAGKGRVKLELVDPLSSAEAEKQANQEFGIEPVPFQVADRYQSSIVSSYFNVLVQYGSEYKVLGFRDLIEVKTGGEADINVQLRNPELDITRTIRAVLQGYQAGGELFTAVDKPLSFTAYISDSSKLPPQLQQFATEINDVLDRLAAKAGDKLSRQTLDPDANGGELAQQLANDYGISPLVTGLLDPNPFYFHLLLGDGEQLLQIPLDDFSADSFERNFSAAVKRFASGYRKTVALVAPAANPYGGGVSFNQLQQYLGDELNVKTEDLTDGTVASDADIVLLAAPEKLDDKALFAVDQFLMQGGTVLLASSPYSGDFSGRSLKLKTVESGLADWLAHHGISQQKTLVLDQQSAALPLPVTRDLGGFRVQEVRMLDYPYFIDVRQNGLNTEHPASASLQQLTLNWASPLSIDSDKNRGRKVTELIHSSNRSWLSDSSDVLPPLNQYGELSFTPEGEQQSYLLGAVVEGEFSSYFVGKDSPLLAAANEATANEETEPTLNLSSVLTRSPASARLIVLSSNDFISDTALHLSGAASGVQNIAALQLVANTLDWALDDAALTSIRARGQFNRTLLPMDEGRQQFWEYLNYGLALLLLAGFILAQRSIQKRRQLAWLRQLAQ
ncbi:Gldg family protein [Rheinheimera sp. NSM]|uniref:Gldg family protein n=1 Tax=Rheinheimera sp. NSM TaxID=3457884 RepID=UPI004036CD40